MVLGLSTGQIDDYLKPRVKEFVGTFPRDLLPNTHRRSAALIVNTDTSDSKGIHRNAIILLKGGQGEYFSSTRNSGIYVFKLFQRIYRMRQINLQTFWGNDP